jgi:hypothetical protein
VSITNPLCYRKFPRKRYFTISLLKEGKNRRFKIVDYNIEVNYRESPYIGFDAWFDETDVDLFFMIEQNY